MSTPTRRRPTGLNLPDDNYDNSSAIFTTNMPPADPPEPVFTAGVLASVKQTPLPITLSGTVFEDLNADNMQDAGEPGIRRRHLDLAGIGQRQLRAPPA